jgi:hypothetical protein
MMSLPASAVERKKAEANENTFVVRPAIRARYVGAQRNGLAHIQHASAPPRHAYIIFHADFQRQQFGKSSAMFSEINSPAVKSQSMKRTSAERKRRRKRELNRSSTRVN